MPAQRDVFLSHNSRDKPIVEEIAARLRERGLTFWLDKLELQPGLPWQEGLGEVFADRRSFHRSGRPGCLGGDFWRTGDDGFEIVMEKKD